MNVPCIDAYGTNGVITAVEIPLARAQPWTDLTVAFPTLASAAAFALDVANAPAVVKRAVSTYQAPIPHRFLKDDELMHAPGFEWKEGGLRDHPESRHVTMVQCTPPGVGPVERLALEHGGQVSRVLPSAPTDGSPPPPRPFYEFGWNHTTLHALKVDKSTTYLQSVLEPEKALELVAKIENQFSTDELMQHLEVVQFGGRVGFASLALLWPQGGDAAKRIGEILSWHEANGMPVFDPHTHVLEDGGMKKTDWAQLGFKRKVDPTGVLNPGKMRAWEEGKANTEASDPRGAFAAAYRVADTSSVGGGGGGDGSTPADIAAPADGADDSADNGADDGAADAPPPPPPSRRSSRYWAEWSTDDFANADLSGAVAVLPIGAIEAHGPHLPLGVDAMHNKALLSRALDALPTDALVLALPPMEVGVSCEHASFAGTLELSAETAAAAWCDIGASVARAGVRKLVLYNSHGGNHPLGEVVARRLRQTHGMLCVLAMNIGVGMQPSSPSASLFPEDEVGLQPLQLLQRPAPPASHPTQQLAATRITALTTLHRLYSHLSSLISHLSSLSSPVCATAPPTPLTSPWAPPSDPHQVRYGIHGGALETSLMLHL